MKVFFKNAVLAILLVAFVILSCNKRTDEQQWEAAITAFIYEHEEDFYNYRAVSFQKIDRAFLGGQEVIQRSLMSLQDTTQRKVSHLLLANLAEEAEKLQPFTSSFEVDQIDDFIKVNALINRSIDLSSSDIDAIRREEQETIAFLDQVFSAFNLSVYNLDFEEQPVIYFHEFLLNGEERSGVFEVDRENMKVLSFRINT